MPKKIEKIHDAEKWIEDISKLADKASTKDSQEKLINLANTTKTLLNDTSIEYEDKAEAFTKALEKIQNVRIESSQILLDPSETIDKSILQEPPKIIIEKIAKMWYIKKAEIESKSDKEIDTTNAKKWIEDIYSLANEGVTPEDKRNILNLADAAKNLIGSKKTDNSLIINFITAIENVKNARATSPFFSTPPGKSIFYFLITNALHLITLNFGKIKGFSSFRQTEKAKDIADLDNLEALDKKTRKKIKTTKDKRFLKDFFEDRIIAEKSDFKRIGEKPSGKAEGYKAAKKISSTTPPFFMIKVALKSGMIRNDKFDTMNFVNEFVTASLYKRTLYDRTPIIAGVKEKKETDEIFFRSKFLHKFETVSEFTDGKEPYLLGSHYNKFENVEGAEKLFANILAWGEYDIHAGNIGIMKIEDGDKTKLVFAKIDHGWSATQFFTDQSALLKNFASAYNRYGYNKKLPLYPNKLKQAIDQITLITDDEIENIVKSKTYQLKQMGFSIKNLNFPCWIDDLEHSFEHAPPKYRSFDSFKELENFYIEKFKTQMKTMRKVSKNLGIISKINYSNIPYIQKIWENGEWLQAINGENPIVWAIDNNEEIDGDDPIEWAKNNNKTIVGKDPIVWAIDNNEEIDGDDPIEWAKDNNKTIEGKDPIVWAIDNNEEIDGNDPIEWAKNNNKKIDDLEPDEYAEKHGISNEDEKARTSSSFKPS